MVEHIDDERADRTDTDPGQAPGGRAAVDRGCTCSVLANAAYRAGAPGERSFVDPVCPLHARRRDP
ncbi:hypothetical protein [Actinomycetospora sp. TBRC 11914]|uniref:hypothetical protein n=1 Tax=Actinomycetospora sp. TBRC 11914 TaxID=2729387 RepID=UPI00145C4BE0|nr:hypothetical protein [Actinomycetospora sp. TBRC 11914]NMO93095.1 hypothetical protein [Actinomycetospora sp. TBRC 11914]